MSALSQLRLPLQWNSAQSTEKSHPIVNTATLPLLDQHMNTLIPEEGNTVKLVKKSRDGTQYRKHSTETDHRITMIRALIVKFHHRLLGITIAMMIGPGMALATFTGDPGTMLPVFL